MSKEKRSTSIIKKLLRFFTLLSAVVILVVPVLFVLPNIAQITPYVVISESMEPSIPVGSILYVGRCEPIELKAGDVITFRMNQATESTTTHRVVENDVEKRQLVTKGDANEDVDIVKIPYLQVIGKVVLSIPKLGYALIFLNTDAGRMSYLAIFLLCIISRFIADRID